MAKCYIAGKITGLPEKEYRGNFEQAKHEVTALGYDPISPVDLPHEHTRTWTAYMREDLSEMLKCDYVYALRNWAESKGASIEVNTAVLVGIKIIYQPHT